MSVMARGRQVLARSPWIYWAVIGALALAAGVSADRAVAGVDAARDAWGDTRSVVVAVVDIEPGGPLAGTTERRLVPAPMVPGSALTELTDGATARQRIDAGEIVVGHDVTAVDGPQARIPGGWLAVPVDVTLARGVFPGDSVTISSGGVVLATGAVIVDVGAPDGSTTLIAVPGDLAPQVAQAAASGDVSLLLEP